MNNKKTLDDFFSMNPLVQFEQKMIECAIFGEFFENGEGALGHHFTSLYIFFPRLKMNRKNLHINTMMICTYGKKKIKVFGRCFFPQNLCKIVDLFFI